MLQPPRYSEETGKGREQRIYKRKKSCTSRRYIERYIVIFVNLILLRSNKSFIRKKRRDMAKIDYSYAVFYSLPLLHVVDFLLLWVNPIRLWRL